MKYDIFIIYSNIYIIEKGERKMERKIREKRGIAK